MPLRLWQRLFLVLALLSAGALACFVAWQQLSFRRSFREYLDRVALQHLQEGAQRLAAAYAQNGNWEFLRRDPARLRDYLDPGVGDRPPPREGPPEGPPPQDGAPDGRRPRPPHPPRPPLPEALHRVLLLDVDGQRVAGNPRVPTDAFSVAVTLGDRPVGRLHMAPLPALVDDLDRGFAAAQWQDALGVGALVLLGALALAFGLARGLLAPVQALAAGTRALAAGDYAQRVDAQRSDELGALARDFNRLAETLEQNRNARRQWGADIAHELRTPLAILRGEIDALHDGVRAPTPQALASLQAECQRLATLVEDLYQLSLADAGALDYRFEHLDLAALARDAVALQSGAFAAAGLRLEAEAAAPAPVRGDARRLAQLLDNLLANARRYTDAPGRVLVRVATQAGEVVLSVDDTAPGVAPAHLPHLFERLYRVDASRSRASGGAGLGLAICRAIVDAHGGRIAAQPSVLGGLSVRATLPAAGAAA